jgi:hypothetical protein|tara:strand:- start:774 stop:1049 length:276 start_codon:yes stop_codon:yes gene_type:complete
MNITYIHNTCKIQTRLAFIEYKRQLDVRLFPYTPDLNSNLQSQMITDINQGVIKTLYKGKVSEEQLKVSNSILISYCSLVLNVSNNYSKKF